MMTAPCGVCGCVALVDRGGIRCACTPALSAAENRARLRAAEARNNSATHVGTGQANSAAVNRHGPGRGALAALTGLNRATPSE